MEKFSPEPEKQLFASHERGPQRRRFSTDWVLIFWKYFYFKINYSIPKNSFINQIDYWSRDNYHLMISISNNFRTKEIILF